LNDIDVRPPKDIADKVGNVGIIENIKSRPKLAAYTDFRQFLLDFYEFKRDQTRKDLRPYSYATFAAAADIRSPNYLKLIIDGERNLSLDMTKKFARAMGLAREEAEEFQALVEYGQASEPLERNRYLKVLADIRVRSQLKSGEITAETWDSVPSWVIWVLSAMADQKGVRFDNLEELARLIRRKTKAEDVRRSFEKLISGGELVRGEAGAIDKGRELMSGSENVPAALVRKLQAELIYLGLESLFQDAPQDREFGAMTASLTETEFEQLKFELRQFRKRWTKDISVQRKTSKGDRVFQLNIQLFPVTKSKTS
jgi:uncharacterized protein (TIGR02147 family)